jgi:uncharacterized membrane protein
MRRPYGFHAETVFQFSPPNGDIAGDETTTGPSSTLKETNMTDTKMLVRSALAALVAVAASATIAQAGPAAKPTYDFEKCYGVAKAGLNDCETATHSCAGTSTADAQGDSWLYLPAGTCSKLSGGSPDPKA